MKRAPVLAMPRSVLLQEESHMPSEIQLGGQLDAQYSAGGGGLGEGGGGVAAQTLRMLRRNVLGHFRAALSSRLCRCVLAWRWCGHRTVSRWRVGV